MVRSVQLVLSSGGYIRARQFFPFWKKDSEMKKNLADFLKAVGDEPRALALYVVRRRCLFVKEISVGIKRSSS